MIFPYSSTRKQLQESPGLVLTGVMFVVLLALHGASFLAMKTRGELQAKAEALAKPVTVVLVLLLVAVVMALPSVQPAFGAHYAGAPIGYVWPLTAVVLLVVRYVSAGRQRPFVGFVASSLLVASLLVAAARGIFPNLLIATTGQANSLTTLNAAADRTGLEAGLWWVPPGLLLVIFYQVYFIASPPDPCVSRYSSPSWGQVLQSSSKTG